MAESKGKKTGGSLLHRYLTSIIFACCVLVLIGSTLAGARMITVIYRASLVFFILYVTRGIIIRSWTAWQETMRGAGKD